MSDTKARSEKAWQSSPDTRYWENMHIPLWLLKDTCWMLEWRWMGVIMIVPTMLTAIYILMKSKGYNEFYINLAICFWITANSFWMCSEFFGFVEYKDLAGIPFVLGMISVSYYYFKQSKNKEV
jgi:hypothetical protein